MPENKSRFVLLCQHLLAVTLVGVVAASAAGVTELEIVSPDGVRTLVSAAPVEPTVRSVPLETERPAPPSPESRTGGSDAQEIRAVSDPEPVVGYATVGVTWDADRLPAEEDLTVELRTSTDGSWSAWQQLHYDADHAPDPGSPEAPQTDELRNGTEPVVVGAVDDVQVRATTADGEPLDGVELDIVDPGKGATRMEAPGIDTASLTSSTAALAAGVPARPTILTRAQWGADEKLRNAASLSYGTVRTGFVHHTVNANNYTKEQVPQIIRGIYAYHTKGRGWSDVGYNFLVDRFGQIWEGRYGGVDKAVFGAHTSGYNGSSFAMSAIGDFDKVAPSDALVAAYGSLMAWKLAVHGVDAGATNVRVSNRTFHGINGHRDAGSTACPGRHLYAQLPTIRSRAVALQKQAKATSVTPKPTPPPTTAPKPAPKPAHPTTTLSLNLQGDAWPDLVMRDRTNQRLYVVRTGGQLAFERTVVVPRTWKGYDLVRSPGDLNGDGISEVMARVKKTGVTTIFAGTRTGAPGKVLHTTTRFAGADQITGVGDFDRDGRNDVVARTAAKRLALFPGRGDGTFRAAKVLYADWKAYTGTAGVDDFDGDGRPDLIARTGPRVHLIPGRGTAIAKARNLVRPGGSGTWVGYDVVTGRGDLTGDGAADLVVRATANGRVMVYPGNGRGAVTAPLGTFPGYEKLGGLTAVDRLKGDGKPDLVGLDGSYRVVVAAHAGRTNHDRPRDTGVMAADIDLLTNAGDWNGDGIGDVITRDRATGTLHLRAGTKAGGLGKPAVLTRSGSGLTRVAAAGDMTGDGWPDLIATLGGQDVVLPNVAGKSIGTPTRYRKLVKGAAQAGVGDRDGDRRPDSVVREGTRLSVWSSRTGTATPVTTLGATYTWLLGPGDLDGDRRADLVGRTKDGALYILSGTTKGFAAPRLIGVGFERFDLGS